MPPAKNDTAAKQAAPKKPAADDRGDEEVLFIKSVPVTFRRCGLRFTREGYGIERAALTKKQIEILEKDPNLVVTRGTATGDAE